MMCVWCVWKHLCTSIVLFLLDTSWVTNIPAIWDFWFLHKHTKKKTTSVLSPVQLFCCCWFNQLTDSQLDCPPAFWIAGLIYTLHASQDIACECLHRVKSLYLRVMWACPLGGTVTWTCEFWVNVIEQVLLFTLCLGFHCFWIWSNPLKKCHSSSNCFCTQSDTPSSQPISGRPAYSAEKTHNV